MDAIEIAVIGGSGLYQMDQVRDIEELTIETPFGPPSGEITVGTLHGRRVAFLPRHGRGHVLTPSTVPYRANIYALKSLGVKYIIAVSACGSLKEEYAPGHIVLPDQLFDHTKLRQSSFFEDGMVVHVGVADPFSAELNRAVAHSVRAVGGVAHEGGTFITIEGPRFSTRGESNIYRQWGCSIIGMTTSPEAFLAREAEIAYSVLAHVTDYDVWHQSAEPVSVEMVIRTLLQNTVVARQAIDHLVANFDQWQGEMEAHSALKDAFITHPSKISAESRTKFALLVNRYLPQ